MKMAGMLIGWVLFIVAAAGLYFLMKGKGRLRSLKSWDSLRVVYRTDSMPARYELASGIVGSARYRNTLHIALTHEGAYLAPGVGINKKPVLIPYSAFVTEPGNERVSWGFYTYAHFIVQGVDVALDDSVAQKIVARQNELNQP